MKKLRIKNEGIKNYPESSRWLLCLHQNYICKFKVNKNKNQTMAIGTKGRFQGVDYQDYILILD